MSISGPAPGLESVTPPAVSRYTHSFKPADKADAHRRKEAHGRWRVTQERILPVDEVEFDSRKTH